MIISAHVRFVHNWIWHWEWVSCTQAQNVYTSLQYELRCLRWDISLAYNLCSSDLECCVAIIVGNWIEFFTWQWKMVLNESITTSCASTYLFEFGVAHWQTRSGQVQHCVLCQHWNLMFVRNAVSELLLGVFISCDWEPEEGRCY